MRYQPGSLRCGLCRRPCAFALLARLAATRRSAAKSVPGPGPGQIWQCGDDGGAPWVNPDRVMPGPAVYYVCVRRATRAESCPDSRRNSVVAASGQEDRGVSVMVEARLASVSGGSRRGDRRCFIARLKYCRNGSASRSADLLASSGIGDRAAADCTKEVPVSDDRCDARCCGRDAGQSNRQMHRYLAWHKCQTHLPRATIGGRGLSGAC